MRPSRLLSLLLVTLACVPLAGCHTTAKNTRTSATFSAADLDHVAVVFSEGNIVEKSFWTTTPDSAATAAASHLVPSLLKAFAPHFGVRLVDAREQLAEDTLFRANAIARLGEAVGAIRAENLEVEKKPLSEGRVARDAPISVAVAEDLVEVSERTGCRYLLTVSVAGWDATTGEKVTEGILKGVAAVALGVVVTGGPPNRLVVIETALVDTGRGEVVWYSTRGAELDPQNPKHVAALTRTVAFELFDGRLISPQSFLSPINQNAVVYRLDGPRVTGLVTGFEGLDVLIDTRDGEVRIPLREVKSIRGFTGTGKLFPIDIPMAE